MNPRQLALGVTAGAVALTGVAALVQQNIVATHHAATNVKGVKFTASTNSAASNKPNNGNANGNTFSISGDTTGLEPGVAVPLVLTASNKYGFDISIDQLTVTVQSISAPGSCPTSIDTGSHSQPILTAVPELPATIPAKGSGSVTVMLTLNPLAPNGCANGQFNLAYSADAVKA